MKSFTIVFLCVGTFVLAINSQPCIDIGRSCSVDENCCPGNLCNNRGKCVESCGPLGTQCGGRFRCCTGLMCLRGRCCAADGTQCRQNFECCGRQCFRGRCSRRSV